MNREGAAADAIALVAIYLFIAYALSAVMEDSPGFLRSLAVVVGARAIFAFAEWVAHLLAWNVYRRRLAIGWLVGALRHPKADVNAMGRPNAAFSFEAMPENMQIELLRWVADQGLLHEGRTEDVIARAVERVYGPTVRG